MGDTGDTAGSGHDPIGGVAQPEELLRKIIELTDDAVITCDLGTTVTFFSENAERLFGRAPEDVVGAPSASCSHGI